MKGFVQDIEDLAVKNDEFRRVLYTAQHYFTVDLPRSPVPATASVLTP